MKILSPNKSLFILASALALFMASCGTVTTKTYTIDDVTMVAEGPLFDGSNTLQATVPIDLKKLESWATAENVDKVTVKSITLTTTDSIGFDRIRSVIFQVTADGAQMQQAAVLNPVPTGVSNINLNPALDADLKDLFKQSALILVADADLNGDMDGNLEYKAKIEFEVSLKD
jgi:hypothetical protein